MQSEPFQLLNGDQKLSIWLQVVFRICYELNELNKLYTTHFLFDQEERKIVLEIILYIPKKGSTGG